MAVAVYYSLAATRPRDVAGLLGGTFSLWGSYYITHHTVTEPLNPLQPPSWGPCMKLLSQMILPSADHIPFVVWGETISCLWRVETSNLNSLLTRMGLACALLFHDERCPALKTRQTWERANAMSTGVRVQRPALQLPQHCLDHSPD
ncbi:hypothetical protein P7K49_033983, partial [Saguinus oedipus]